MKSRNLGWGIFMATYWRWGMFFSPRHNVPPPLPLDTLPCSFHKIKRRTKSFKQFQKIKIKIKIKISAKSFPKVRIRIIIVGSFMVFLIFFWLPTVRGSTYSCASGLVLCLTHLPLLSFLRLF